MKEIGFAINVISNVFTIFASGIAIYIFFFKSEKVVSALNFILNYSNQLTLADLKYKIERLNDYNANDKTQKVEVINILYEIEGQINGNKILKNTLTEQLNKILAFTENERTLTEPKKRSLVSELRESLRALDISNIKGLMINKDK